MGCGSSSRSSSVDLTTSQNTTVTIRNSWVETRGPRALPHSGQNLGRSTSWLPQFGHVAMAGVYGRSGKRTVLLVTVPASGEIGGNSGTRNGAGWLPCGRDPEPRSGVVAPERKRSARDYEQALRRQELSAGRALVQALPAEGAPGPRELAAARRVLTQSLFELRRLGRELDQEIEALRARSKGAARPAAQRSNPGELERLEAVRNAVEEVAERWEGRRDQLSAELDRRQPRQARQPRRTNEVRNRGGAAPARPGRPQSPRSRRSRG